ncbi:MFS transporter [Saccharopolyspora rosea]|uniref:MFS transporter n=1 Tax=Saccharopolyspora rosea TaxID=524884 RepID=UPI0021D960E2|nr:MFS transporter [Saccharopolyspora rosea]
MPGGGAGGAGANVLNVALPTIQRQLGGGPDAALWVLDGYTLTFAALLLTGGSLGTRFGVRRVFLIGLWMFGLASVACGLAGETGELVAARAIQVIGAALLAPGSLALISHLHPERHRARALGAWAGVSGAAFAAGPVVSGLLIDTLGWRTLFLINVPMVLLALALVHPFVPAPAGQAHRFDIAGQVLAVVGLGTLTAALVEVSRVGWTLPGVLGALTAGLVLLAGFAAVQRRKERADGAPMLPPSLLAVRPARAGLLAALAYNFGLYGMLVLYTFLLQGFHTDPHAHTPWAMLLVAAVFAAAAITTWTWIPHSTSTVEPQEEVIVTQAE